MDKNILREYLKKPNSRQEIIREFCRDKVVLDIGCVHHDIDNADHETWLHKTVVEVAADTLGVDYLEEEVAALVLRGYKMMVGDLNKKLEIDRKFDVIVVGNLIEHLSNFEGLLNNLRRLLKPDGVVLISTANPFYREQYFYSALKNDIIVNPEHTCWIDPVTLDQLCGRFEFETVEVRWVKERWRLSQTIFNGERQTIDTFTGRWIFHSPPGAFEQLASRCLELAFRIPLQPARQLRVKKRYGDSLGRFLYLLLKGVFVDAWWLLRRAIIPTSDINRYELYVSILKVNNCAGNDESKSVTEEIGHG
ncbi:methyltransferase domain-containing protein [Pseudomonadota bacterium]